MSKAINFEFTSYLFEPENNRAIFNYKTELKNREPIFWKEEICFSKIPEDVLEELKNKLSDRYLILDKILKSLHIILGTSYYKFYCATNIKLPKSYSLTKEESIFWNTVYKKGLGEFFYKNSLNPKISPKFSFNKNKKTENFILPKYNNFLVGVSGGKDSIVGLELLKKTKQKLTAFYIETNNESSIVNNIIDISELSCLKIKRILDSKVFKTHQYNGHIPISAIYAFLGIFSCVLYKYDNFVVSNEYSSNFGNIKYKNLEINHQWSKSFEFEKMFSNYLKENISNNIFYFSILRQFYEIRVVEMFTKYSKYFYSFSSCNKNFLLKNKDNLNKKYWCGRCAKCVFVFILLSAFLNKKELIKIFKNNLYEKKDLLSLFKDVLGFGNIKPFDCVGTFSEAQTAFKIASIKYKRDFIIKRLLKNTKIYNDVFKIQKENNIPEKLKFLGIKNILILGYGKEGYTNKKYLQKFYPNIKIGISDIKIQGKNYLQKQDKYDFAIKTPSINKDLLKIPHTTATNIFFSEIYNNNIIIGITGSKGKSTTSSLIYEILKLAGRDVEILGNIGKPMLKYLVENELPKNKIFVLELSSYQLDDINFSPHISVVTNLFPEHLDYHKNLNNYYNAKKNIINFQTNKDYFVYNSKNKILRKWLNNYGGIKVPFYKSNIKSNLLGEHNKGNVACAVEVSKILKIPENIIKKAIINFKGLPHRLEFVGEFFNIKFYDDAISTTPESTIMAIRSLPKIGTIFLGGQDRGYNFSQLEKIIIKHKIKNVVLFPDSGNKILKSKKGLNILYTKKMKEAVSFAFKNTNKGEICLLSCASPSYSLWKNFEEKGNQFKKSIFYIAKKFDKNKNK